MNIKFQSVQASYNMENQEWVYIRSEHNIPDAYTKVKKVYLYVPFQKSCLDHAIKLWFVEFNELDFVVNKMKY